MLKAKQDDSKPPMTNLSVPANEDAISLAGVSLVIRQQTPIQLLPGFSKTKHRLPDSNDRRAQEFVARLGERLIRDDLDAAYTQIREALGLKRRQLKVTESDEGFGTIETPFFLYSNGVFQSDGDAVTAVWQRDLSRIVKPAILLEDACNRLFASIFDTIEFVPSSSINLEKLVDHLEDLGDEQVRADYDRQLTYCNILMQDSPLYIQVNRHAFRVVHPAAVAPRELIACIQDIRRNLVDFTNLS